MKVTVEIPKGFCLVFVSVTANDDFGTNLRRDFAIVCGNCISICIEFRYVLLYLTDDLREFRASVITVVRIVVLEEWRTIQWSLDFNHFDIIVHGASNNKILVFITCPMATAEKLAVFGTKHPRRLREKPLEF